MAIFEVLQFSAGVKQAIFEHKSALDIKRSAIQVDKMISLRGSALLALKNGLTSIEEVISGTVEDDL